MATRGVGWAGSLGLLILRLGMGGYLLAHGWSKAELVLQGNFANFPDPIGLGSTTSLVLTAFAEAVCSGLVMVGLLTRLAAIPVVIAMGVAAFVVHAEDAWTMGEGASREPALLFLIPFLALVFLGAGKFSLDNVLWSRKRRDED